MSKYHVTVIVSDHVFEKLILNFDVNASSRDSALILAGLSLVDHGFDAETTEVVSVGLVKKEYVD